MGSEILSQACRQMVLDRVSNPVDIGRVSLEFQLASAEFVRLYSLASLDGTLAAADDAKQFFDDLHSHVFRSRHKLCQEILEGERNRLAHVRRQRQGISTDSDQGEE